jgi:LmbE family N-acetylglucosaminyl deacetylase
MYPEFPGASCLLGALCSRAGRNGSSGILEVAGGSLRVLVLAAHPEDAVIGAGGQLARWQPLRVVHVTDGVPRHLRGDSAYADARRAEAEAALAVAGVESDRIERLGLLDQEVAYELVRLHGMLVDLLSSLRPRVVVTHGYEGGHPDHDAIAFAVHHACRRLGPRAPALVEMTSSHIRRGRICSGRFLADPSAPRCTVPLMGAESDLKARMVRCFRTQAPVIAALRPQRARESFRIAPGYDFSRPPHSGALLYEVFHWAFGGMTWRRWRRLCAEARPFFGLG